MQEIEREYAETQRKNQEEITTKLAEHDRKWAVTKAENDRKLAAHEQNMDRMQREAERQDQQASERRQREKEIFGRLEKAQSAWMNAGMKMDRDPEEMRKLRENIENIKRELQAEKEHQKASTAS